MRDLRLIGVHDDGEHLVVTDDAGEEYRLRIDEPLRAAARRDRPRLGQLQIAIDNNVRPREVQAMIRAGATPDEVAARTGWDLDKIARFEGPVIAEREHVATRAQAVRMRGANQAGAPETLSQRAATRLTGRGVDPASVEWDAFRDAEGQWTVTAIFTAGGRERTATWWFDMAGMSVVAKNDEAKWLAEADTPAGPVPATVHRPTAVFDVEVEEKSAERATRANTDDLINSMREHSGAKSRRGGGRRGRTTDTAPAVTEDALPLDALDEAPPAARGTHPKDLEEATEREPHEDATGDSRTDPTSPAGGEPDVAPEQEDALFDDHAEDDESAEDTHEETAGPEDAATAPAADAESAREETSPDESTSEELASDELASEELASHELMSHESTSEEASPEETTGRGRSKGKNRSRKGRASVPSWDDVMFGTAKE